MNDERKLDETKLNNFASIEQLEREIMRKKKISIMGGRVKNTFFYLIIVVAFSVLLVTFLLPTLRIYGNSMEPNLSEGEYVVSFKSSTYETGDIVAFYVGNNVLIKRIVATSGQWINIDEEGNVYVNNNLIEESYVKHKSIGQTDIKFPYQVPENKYFVLGDYRSVSADSRSTQIGCVGEKQFVGKVKLRLWPIYKIGVVK